MLLHQAHKSTHTFISAAAGCGETAVRKHSQSVRVDSTVAVQYSSGRTTATHPPVTLQQQGYQPEHAAHLHARVLRSSSDSMALDNASFRPPQLQPPRSVSRGSIKWDEHLPKLEVKETIRHHDTTALKKARRREQCRVNQANYRRRKQALEQVTARGIAALQLEIRELERRHSRARRSPPCRLDDYAHTLRELVVQISSGGHSASSAVDRQILTVVDLEHGEFKSLAEWSTSWQQYARFFESFHIELRSISELQTGDSALLRVEASLACSLWTRSTMRQSTNLHNHHMEANCPLVLRLVFEPTRDVPSKVICEVDWVTGIWGVSSTPKALSQELVAVSRRDRSPRSTSRSGVVDEYPLEPSPPPVTTTVYGIRDHYSSTHW